MDSYQLLVKRAAILHHNAFGFQPPDQGVRDEFVIASISEIGNNQIKKINEMADTKTVKEIDWVGRYFIGVHWTEYNKIETIFNVMLKLGMIFITWNKLSAKFNPVVDKIYTRQFEELKAIEHIKKFLEDFRHDFYGAYDLNLINDAWLNIWNWKTDQGKEFCTLCNKKLFKPPPNMDHKDNYFNWDIFKNCDFSTLLNIDSKDKQESKNEEDKIKKEEPEEEDDEKYCLICMANEPDTTVFPCGHHIVCKICSVKLRETHDAKICVKCRRQITSISE